MSHGPVVRQDHDAVRALLLNRPPSNNLSLALLNALIEEVEAVRADPRVRCLVLGSALPKYFSSGLDLSEMLSLPDGQRPEFFHRLMRVHRALRDLSCPTVAAVGGYALLGGFILTLACDVRCIAEESGRVSLSEIRLGLSPTTPLIRLVLAATGRPGLVKELLLQGKTLKASEALAAGLVDDILPSDGFWDAALHKAHQLAKVPPRAYASVKRAVRSALLPNEDELWAQGAREFQELFSGPEAREGIAAMREKRKPRWE
ncbi:MAG: enoyl-CoA hydratase/isomerase family protein [Elusimicrobia bacterium]|nr:enoyl-CoA hydratase/isomerase family protein [Elusimicrobiota bacterium]